MVATLKFEKMYLMQVCMFISTIVLKKVFSKSKQVPIAQAKVLY